MKDDGQPTRRWQFSLLSVFLFVVPMSWFFAMVRLGGVGHVAAAFYLGAISGTYVGAGLGLLGGGSSAESRRRSWSKLGVLIGAMLGCTLGGLVPGKAYHLVLPIMAITGYLLVAASSGRWGWRLRLSRAKNRLVQ